MGKLSDELKRFAASVVSPNNELTGAATKGGDVVVGGLVATGSLCGGNNSAILSSSNRSWTSGSSND